MKYTKQEQELAKKLWAEAKAHNTLKRMGVGVVRLKSSLHQPPPATAECTWRAYLPEARAMLQAR